jgi:predicted RNA-binding Zn-ribbon protein involved in translation (DUF1610 family)
MKLACLSCARVVEVPEGGDPASLRCPACGAVRGEHFAHAKSVRFESAAHPDHERAVAALARGELDAAFASLAEALKGGFDPELLAHDPALAKLRSDPRWPALFGRRA